MRELNSICGLEVITTDEGRRLDSVSQVIVDLAAGELTAVKLGEPPEEEDAKSEDPEQVGDHEKKDS